MPRNIAVHLSRAAQRALRQGHPWIFATGIERLRGKGRAGDLAVVFDRHTDRFLAVGLYEPNAPLAIRILHAGGPVRIDQAFFAQRVAEAHRRRAPLLAGDTNAYRLLNGANDGTPALVADVYDRALVLKVYSKAWVPWLDLLLEPLRAATGCTSVVLRLSRKLAADPSLPEHWTEGRVLLGHLESPSCIFREHGVELRAHLVAGHKTGFFLDHRHNRRLIGERAKDKTVLDVFSYAGGFSAHALAGGARSATALDISRPALDLALDNAALNGRRDRLQTIAGDAFRELEALRASGRRFDLVVVDPPAFAKNASERDRALRAYRSLTQLAVPLVAPGGLLLLASCSAPIEAEAFYDLQHEVLRSLARPYRERLRTSHDLDHPVTFAQAAYLKSLYVDFDGPLQRRV